jgi:hypothetical protein
VRGGCDWEEEEEVAAGAAAEAGGGAPPPCKVEAGSRGEDLCSTPATVGGAAEMVTRGEEAVDAPGIAG